MCNIELPQGASVDRTDAVLKEFLARIADIPGIRSSMVISGRSMMSGSGENVAMCILRLAPWDQRKTPELQIDAIMTQIQEKTRTISDATVIAFTPPAIMGLGATGGATFKLCGIGDIDPGELSEIARKFAMTLSSNPVTRYAMTSYNADTPQLFLDIDREKAETLGVSTKTIFSTLQSKLASLYVNDFTLYPEQCILLLMIVALIGGCSGSTSGGIKFSRLRIIYEFLKNSFGKVVHPNAVYDVKMDGASVSNETVQSTLIVFLMFVLTIIVGTILILIIGITQPTVNGQPIDYEAWPLIANPWAEQSVDGRFLTLVYGNEARVYDFREWIIR